MDNSMGIGILLSYSVSGLSSITSADRLMSKFLTTNSANEQVLNRLGIAMTNLAAGAITLSAGVALVNTTMGNMQAYADYEESLVYTQGLLGATREEMAAMEEQAFSLARTTRFTAGESMDAYYELLSAGLTQQEAMDTLETTLHGAVIGHMEAAESADMLTTAMRSFQVPATDAEVILDRLTMGVRISKIHFDEYVHSFGTFGGVMQAANQSMSDTIALFGVMRTAGLSASRASMQIKMMGTHIFDISDAENEMLKDMNIHIFNNLGQMRALPDIMQDLFSAMPELTPELIGRSDLTGEEVEEYARGRLRTFTQIFGMRAVAGLLNVYNAQIELNGSFYEGVDAVNAMSSAIEDSTGYAQDYYDTVTSAWNEKKAILDASIQSVKELLGKPLLEMATPLIDKVIEGVNAISAFLEGNPEIAAAIGGATLILGVLASVGGVLLIIAGLKVLFAGVGGIGLIFGGIVSTLGWVLLVILAIGTAAYFVIKYWDEVKAFFVDLGNWLWSKFGTLLTILASIGVFLFDKLLMPFFNFFVTTILPTLLIVVGIIAGIIGAVLIVLDILWGVFQTVHAFLEALFTGDWDKFNEEMDRIWSQIVTEVESLGDLFFTTISTAIIKVADDLSGGLYSRMQASGEVGQGRGILGDTAGQMGGYWDAMWGVDDISLARMGNSMASGVSRVPRDGMYPLHEDEQVVQRGEQAVASGVTIQGGLNFYSYGKEDPEGFARRAYNEFQRMMNEERELRLA